jgi:hypothetical protein
MPQIARYLFAATLVVIFAFVLLYATLQTTWNGGEYWGFDGTTAPKVEANSSFAAGEYRFLRFKLLDPLGKNIDVTPQVSRCHRHPSGKTGFTRTNTVTTANGLDSVKLATEYASEFNFEMYVLLFHSGIADCEGDAPT